MYFICNGKHMACNLDWVSFSVLLKEKEPEICCPEGYRMELLGGNNVFRNRAIIYKDGSKALTLLWSPYSRTINSHIMTVQIANCWLYPACVSAWFSVVSECVECTFNNFSRIDIAIDFEISNRQMSLIRKLNSGACYVAAKSEGSVWWHSTTWKDKDSKFPHCLTWGATKSQFKWKCYNKAREQNTDEHMKTKKKDGSVYVVPPEKPYIVEMWREGGMNIAKVWRLELSINDMGLMRLEKGKGKKIDLSNCDDMGLWYEIMCSEIDRRFVVRKNEGKKRKNEDKRMYLLHLNGWKTAVVHKERNKNPKPKPEIVSALKTILRAIENPVILSDVRMFEYYWGMAQELVQRHNLIGWCMRTLGCGIDEWFEKMNESVGEGIVNGISSAAMLMD